MKKRNFKNDWALFSYITAYIKPYLGILLLATIALAGNLVLLLLRPYLTNVLTKIKPRSLIISSF